MSEDPWEPSISFESVIVTITGDGYKSRHFLGFEGSYWARGRVALVFLSRLQPLRSAQSPSSVGPKIVGDPSRHRRRQPPVGKSRIASSLPSPGALQLTLARPTEASGSSRSPEDYRPASSSRWTTNSGGWEGRFRWASDQALGGVPGHPIWSSNFPKTSPTNRRSRVRLDPWDLCGFLLFELKVYMWMLMA
jgi:hypothetical protein